MAQQNQSSCLENHLNSLLCAGLLGCSSFESIACFLGAMEILRGRIRALKSEQYSYTATYETSLLPDLHLLRVPAELP